MIRVATSFSEDLASDIDSLFREPTAINQAVETSPTPQAKPEQPTTATTNHEPIPIVQIGYAIGKKGDPTEFKWTNLDSPELEWKLIWDKTLQSAETYAADCGLEVMATKDQLKELRQQEKNALESLRDLREKGFNSWRDELIEAAKEGQRDRKNSAAAARDTAMKPTRPAGQDGATATGDDPWRSVPIAELDFDSVKGFGPRKREALFAACPTIGEFEDIRAKQFEGGLTSIDGIGPTLASELENLMLDWLTKNRDKFGEVVESDAEAAATEPAAEPAGENGATGVVLAGASIDAENCVIKFTTRPDAPTTPQSEKQEPTAPEPKPKKPRAANNPPAARKGKLKPDTHSDTEEGCKARFREIKASFDLSRTEDEDLPMWSKGYEAFENGDPYLDCPYSPGGPRTNWLKGWLSSKRDSEIGYAAEESEEGGGK